MRPGLSNNYIRSSIYIGYLDFSALHDFFLCPGPAFCKCGPRFQNSGPGPGLQTTYSIMTPDLHPRRVRCGSPMPPRPEPSFLTHSTTPSLYYYYITVPVSCVRGWHGTGTGVSVSISVTLVSVSAAQPLCALSDPPSLPLRV